MLGRSPWPAADEWSWLRVYWPRPFDPGQALGLLRRLASDERSLPVVWEARASGGQVTWIAGAPTGHRIELTGLLEQLVPGTHVVADDPARRSVQAAGGLRATTWHRPLRVAETLATTWAVLTALAAASDSEELVLQVVLGPRRVPLAVPTNSPASVVQPWWYAVWGGDGPRIDGEKREALRAKVSDHGFACAVRLGVVAASSARQQTLLLGLLAGARTAEAAGVMLRLRRERPGRLDGVRRPWRWPLRLNVAELLTIAGWPLGDDPLPGVGEAHPRLLRAVPGVSGRGRVLARATAPGDNRELGLSARDALQHLHVLGPTGTGKSTLLLRLICQDIAAGRGVVVVDPKGDLVDDVLARVPEQRRDNVVVLDPADDTPVGLNPLAVAGRRAEVAVDGVLAVFHALYADAWGPRTQDILHAGLLTLARHGDASLVMLPLLLTNPGFRRSLTARLYKEDPVALGPFWAWYEGLSDAERGQVIAPVMNKLRAFLLRPTMRAVLGQRQPKFSLRQVFTERKILLVSLNRGLLGPEAAGLLGSLVVAQLWNSTLARAAVPAARRHPVLAYIDEVQDYLHLPTDLGDALVQARSLGVGFTLAHQFLAQLPGPMRAAVLGSVRSRVYFQLGSEDATALARSVPQLDAEDFRALGRYEVYASLLTDGAVTPYASGRTLPPPATVGDPTVMRAASRASYGRTLDEIETELAKLTERDKDENGPVGRRPRRRS